MEGQSCIYLGIKVKPGAIERHKLENFSLDNTVTLLKSEAEKKANVPSDSLELIHHGKILKDLTATLQDSGIKSGSMVHVVKKKCEPPPEAPQPPSDTELGQIVTSLRTFGTPSAPGWTRAMQVLNDESTMSQILEAVPTLSDDCVTLSILHEIELLAALGAMIHTMRRGAQGRPNLPAALQQLIRIVRAQNNTGGNTDNVPTSGFAYSLEALSEDEDGDEEESESGSGGNITQEQLAAALQAATEAVAGATASASGASSTQESLLRYLQGSGETSANTPSNTGSIRSFITPDMFNDAITEAMSLSNSAQNTANPGTPMEQSTNASTSQSPRTTGSSDEDFTSQLSHMHEMGLLDDAINVRALLMCAGDVNAAINLVFSGAMEE